MELESEIAATLDEFEVFARSQIYVVALYVHLRWPDLDFPLLEGGRPFESRRPFESLREAYLRMTQRRN